MKKQYWMGVSFNEDSQLLARLIKGGDIEATKEWARLLKSQNATL